MNLSTPAQQNYNAGIIFLSYVIAVIGAFTTLELLQRRTHIRGYYNWLVQIAVCYPINWLTIKFYRFLKVFIVRSSSIHGRCGHLVNAFHW